MKVDAVSVVSEKKKLIGKATRDAIEEKRLKAEKRKAENGKLNRVALRQSKSRSCDAANRCYLG
jgi:hypothetical protein